MELESVIPGGQGGSKEGSNVTGRHLRFTLGALLARSQVWETKGMTAKR